MQIADVEIAFVQCNADIDPHFESGANYIKTVVQCSIKIGLRLYKAIVQCSVKIGGVFIKLWWSAA